MIIGYINKQSLRIGQNLVVTGTIDYLEAEFHFTDDWTGLQKWAHFKCGENDYKVMLDEDDRITKDKHLNLTTGTWTVWLHGDELHDGEVKQRATTDQQTITVKNTGVAEDGQPFEPMEPSVTEQILALVDKAQGTADAVTQDVKDLWEYTRSSIDDINHDIGNIDDLYTVDKSSIISAINEVLSKAEIQSDYEEYDSTKKSFIKNRPFYHDYYKYEYSHVFTVEETTWSGWTAGSTFKLIGNEFDLDKGDKFSIELVIGTQRYNTSAVPKVLSSSDVSGHNEFAGHKGIVLKVTAISIVVVDTMDVLVLYSFNSNPLASIYIRCTSSQQVDVLKKIDDKFLPDIDYSKIKNAPEIPDSEDVAEWGFAKQESVNEKQDKLVSGENVKTVNGESILGSGDIKVISENADYTENDSAKPSYIENRPFYSESYTYEFDHTYPASETTWTKWSVGEIFLLNYPIGIEDGEEFEVTVSLGSKTITGVCTVRELSYVDAVMMPEYTGKTGFVLNNSNLSLTFVAVNGGTVIVKSVGTLYARYTLNSIRIVCTKSKKLETIHPLDKKFLPDINFDDLKDKPQIPSDEYIEQLIERKVNDMILSVEEVLF